MFYCSHAHVGFGTLKEAAEARELTDLKIAGRKVYIFPAYLELMQDLPNLGSPKKKKAVKDVEAEEVGYCPSNNLVPAFLNFFCVC